MDQKLRSIIDQNVTDLTTAVDLFYAAVGLPAIRAEQGRLGGLVRRIKTHGRVYLAGKLIEKLGIESTQTVAKKVMLAAFDQAASTADLTQSFAKPGRSANEKFVDQAMLALQNKSADVASCKADYEAFSARLVEKLSQIKALRKPS
jgi:hypothetical protein